MADLSRTKTFAVADYDLHATLASGQVFRWTYQKPHWTGIVGSRWVRLELQDSTLIATTAQPVADWSWLIHFLQLELELDQVLRTFPADEPMRAAVTHCRGLRLLRQDPWECLASFILSSTKQIVQIQQIVANLSRCFGQPLATPETLGPGYAFPTPERLAQTTEVELRHCKMGFRAPYLLGTAQAITSGKLDLTALNQLSVDAARLELMSLPGVGRKIADCVLLFAYGFPTAFPIDVWVMRALQELYFPRRRPEPELLRRFAEQHFGPHAGYAQQYLFHYMRTRVT